MQINNSINLIQLNINNELFENGDIIEGEILEIIDDLVIIDFKDLGIIRAFTENDLLDYKNDSLKFEVRSSMPNKIELKPIFNDAESINNLENNNDEVIDFESKAEDYLTNILKEFNIKEDPVSMEFLDTLIKYNVKLDESNLSGGIKVLDKLEQIVNLGEEDIIILANSSENEVDIGREDLKNFIIKDGIENSTNIDLKTQPYTESKENKIQLIEKNNFRIIENSHMKSITKGYLEGEDSRKELNLDTIKTIGFFTKFNIKPTLNNIKYFLQIKENSSLFSEDFKILEKVIDDEFTNHLKRFSINKEDTTSLIEDGNLNYKEGLEKIERELEKNFHFVNKDIKKTVEELRNKTEFLDEMNKELTFIYLPINFDVNYESTITLLKQKKNKDRSNNKINVFINLNTNTLGNIKIMCEVLNNNIMVKFNDVKKEDINLFRSNEEYLKTLVQSTGYDIGSIEYSIEKNNYNILNSLIVNKNPIYYLDVQV